MIPKPGLYCDYAGLLAIGEGRDGEVVAVRIPLDLDGLEDAARKILDAVRAMRQAQRQAAGAAACALPESGRQGRALPARLPGAGFRRSAAAQAGRCAGR